MSELVESLETGDVVAYAGAGRVVIFDGSTFAVWEGDQLVERVVVPDARYPDNVFEIAARWSR